MKFEIGETLRHISDKKPLFEKYFTQELLVIERSLQECPGGIQRNYLCRSIAKNSPSTTLVQFNEIELIEIKDEK